MRRILPIPALLATALALVGGAQAQPAEEGEGGDLIAPPGTETLNDVATRPAGIDAVVRGGAFLRQPQAAVNAAIETDLAPGGDVRAPALSDIPAGVRLPPGAAADSPRQDHPHGSYFYVDGTGWVWVARAAQSMAQ